MALNLVNLWVSAVSNVGVDVDVQQVDRFQ